MKLFISKILKSCVVSHKVPMHTTSKLKVEPPRLTSHDQLHEEKKFIKYINPDLLTHKRIAITPLPNKTHHFKIKQSMYEKTRPATLSHARSFSEQNYFPPTTSAIPLKIFSLHAELSRASPCIPSSFQSTLIGWNKSSCPFFLSVE